MLGNMKTNIDNLSSEERLDEVASILAAGIIRLRHKRRETLNKHGFGEIPVDLVPTGSMCGTVNNKDGETQ